MKETSIRDNRNYGNVGDFLDNEITNSSNLSIVSAYFTIYAYHQLKEKLNNIEKLRFLFGEPTFIKAVDPDKANLREYKIEDNTLVITNEKRLLQKSVAKECADWITDKVDIRSMVKPNFLHGKMYHIKQENGVEKAIIGSSNFTVNGLGFGGQTNIELNTIIDSDRDRKELSKWFDDIWNDPSGIVEDVKEKVLEYLAQIYAENVPEFIYYKTLFHIFEDFLDEQKTGGLLNERTGFYDSQIWNSLYAFQRDGVKGAINKILKHNGCIIADSVGLGKTYEALAIIKYFELLNYRVLVLCPKKLSNNWSIYQASQNNFYNPFKKDRFNYSLIYHTDVGRTSGTSGANNIDLANFNWGAYDLIIIDESHNFKGNLLDIKSDNPEDIKMNRAKFLMEQIIKSGVKTKVLMLSATPVNNTLRDLRNQIAYITEGDPTALLETSGINDINQTLQTAQRQFTVWADDKTPGKSAKELLGNLDSSFFKLLDELTIARSRKHILKYYNPDSIGKFPTRSKPISIYPDIDTLHLFPSYQEIDGKIDKYQLAIFKPSKYVKKEKTEEYERKVDNLTFTQAHRENTLANMMKINFLKRLESSIESFEITLARTISNIENLETKINGFIASQTQSEEITLDTFEPPEEDREDIEEDAEEWQVGKRMKYDLADIDVEQWLVDLEKDKTELIKLCEEAKKVTPDRDAKLQRLKSLIEEKIADPNPNKKILIFTAFADTAEYLYKNIEPWYRKKFERQCSLISGNGTKTTYGKNEYNAILTNFSPISKQRGEMNNARHDKEIDLIVATDCISEGQNLQDCGYLINYDIHWNPVRIIQRFGRIDRLGSINEFAHLVNFWPTNDLDQYINLKKRVEAKMALVDVSATAEDNILDTEHFHDLITDELKYRDRQLKRLQNEVLDLEDMDDSISITDFSLDDFRIELLNYIQNNRQKLLEAPMGLYALTPSLNHAECPSNILNLFNANQSDIIRPGAVFCLKQKKTSKESESVNPLSPYFLVYIRNDGTVRYNYVNAKQILEIFRLTCQNITSPYETLCKDFNSETNDGQNMQTYAELLKKAVNEIVSVYTKRESAKLSNDRSALLTTPAKRPAHIDNFELITWLILR